MSQDNKVGILGAGGLARELCGILISRKSVENICFFDHGSSDSALTVLSNSIPVEQENKILENKTTELDLVCGVGDPSLRQQLFKRFERFNFLNIAHDTAIVEGVEEQGVGNVYTAGVISTVNIRVGSNNYFNLGVTIGHDTQIGDHNVFNPGVNISGGVTIGNSCLLGTGAQILQDLSICSNVIIGAGALVTKSIVEAGTYVGVPAKKIR